MNSKNYLFSINFSNVFIIFVEVYKDNMLRRLSFEVFKYQFSKEFIYHALFVVRFKCLLLIIICLIKLSFKLFTQYFILDWNLPKLSRISQSLIKNYLHGKCQWSGIIFVAHSCLTYMASLSSSYPSSGLAGLADSARSAMYSSNLSSSF